MSKKDYMPASKHELEQEARRWEAGATSLEGWIDAPDAIPRSRASTLISLRVPTQMLEILKVLAAREGVGYQVLIKRWLDERIRQERDSLVANQVVRLNQPGAGKVADASPGEGQQLGDLPEDEVRFVRELVGFLREKAKRKKKTGTNPRG